MEISNWIFECPVNQEEINDTFFHKFKYEKNQIFFLSNNDFTVGLHKTSNQNE